MRLFFKRKRKTKQSGYAIINHDNLKPKASLWFVSLKILEATFCAGVKTKRPTRNPTCTREIPGEFCGVFLPGHKVLCTALWPRVLKHIPGGFRLVKAFTIITLSLWEIKWLFRLASAVFSLTLQLCFAIAFFLYSISKYKGRSYWVGCPFVNSPAFLTFKSLFVRSFSRLSTALFFPCFLLFARNFFFPRSSMSSPTGKALDLVLRSFSRHFQRGGWQSKFSFWFWSLSLGKFSFLTELMQSIFSMFPLLLNSLFLYLASAVALFFSSRPN